MGSSVGEAAGLGVVAVEHVVARVVDAGAKVDCEGTFGDVVGVEEFLEGERCSLAICELDQHSGAEVQECFGWKLVEDWLGLVEGPVRSYGGVEGGLGHVDELVAMKALRWRIKVGLRR